MNAYLPVTPNQARELSNRGSVVVIAPNTLSNIVGMCENSALTDQVTVYAGRFDEEYSKMELAHRKGDKKFNPILCLAAVPISLMLELRETKERLEKLKTDFCGRTITPQDDWLIASAHLRVTDMERWLAGAGFCLLDRPGRPLACLLPE